MNKLLTILKIESFKIKNKTFILHNIFILLIFTIIYKYTAREYGTKKDKNNFSNLLDSFYYTTITQFGVGYGDIYPESKHMKCLCIIHVLIVFLIILY